MTLTKDPKCLTQEHRIISYKYPKNSTHSRYNDFFTNEATEPLDRKNMNKSMQFAPRISFNYDQVRNKLKRDYQEQQKSEPGSLERQQNEQKLMFSNETTNRREFFIKGKTKARHDINNAKKFIQEKQKQGSSVMVPMNCFTGSTAYRDKFDRHENVVRADPVIPVA